LICRASTEPQHQREHLLTTYRRNIGHRIHCWHLRGRRLFLVMERFGLFRTQDDVSAARPAPGTQRHFKTPIFPLALLRPARRPWSRLGRCVSVLAQTRQLAELIEREAAFRI